MENAPRSVILDAQSVANECERLPRVGAQLRRPFNGHLAYHRNFVSGTSDAFSVTLCESIDQLLLVASVVFVVFVDFVLLLLDVALTCALIFENASVGPAHTPPPIFLAVGFR